MSDRKLCSYRVISELIPIDGADRIETAVVDGWKVVVKKGEFKVGDNCVYFEIDSFLPASDPRFAFLEKQKRTWRGKEGYRLRTIKLKGQLSQGLVLPADLFPELIEPEKWEEDVPVQLAGMVAGSFPSYLRRSDQERAQNIYKFIIKDAEYEVSLKLDGTSLTVYNNGEGIRVCSRNQELKINEENSNNLYIKTALEQFSNVPEGYAIQAEICGPGIQKNRMGLDKVKAFIFDIFHIPTGEYITPDERYSMVGKFNWAHVPVIPPVSAQVCQVRPELETLEKALSHAEGYYYGNGKAAEGIVYKRKDGKFSFKIISNKYLLEHDL